MSRCPACRKENPFGTVRCDCGYHYVTGEGGSGDAPPEVRRMATEPGGVQAAAGGDPADAAGAAGRSADRTVAFRGSAGEYFGIWIVNTLLKIVTLSIYTAWAKVRTRRYFAGATVLDGMPFEYLAEPKALFRGWLVVAAAVVTYTLARWYSPVLGFVFGAAVVCVIPWVIVRSRVFNSRNLAYRNIRFGFRPDYREAYIAFLGLPLLIPLTLGLLYPYVIHRQKRFQVENSSYGSASFRFTATPKEFYLFFLRSAAALAGLVVATGIAASFVFAGLGPALKGGLRYVSLFPICILALYAMYLVGVATALNNLVWNRTELGDIRFRSDMNPVAVIWLYFSGFAATAVSLGLLFP